jgi:hypothetical protein
MSNTFTTPRVVTTVSQSRLDYNNALTSLLQNFASTGSPNPTDINLEDGTGFRTGMLWYKSGTDTADGQGRLFIYNGTEFTRNGLNAYKMPSITAANTAATSGTVSYGDLILVGSDLLYMVNTANNGIVRIGGDAVTLSGLASTQFVRADIDDDIAGNIAFTSNAFVRLPIGNTAQRPGTSTIGMLRYNTSLNSFEGYDGTEWGEIGGGGAFTDDGTYVHYIGGANVGIGTDTPSANLHVAGAGGILKLETGTTSDVVGVALRISRNSTAIATNSGYGGVEWSGGDTGGSGVRGYVKGFAAGENGEFSVRLATQGSGASSPVDRLSVWSSGNVGIGVLNANTPLQVAGNISVSGGDATIFNRDANYLALGTNNREVLRITPTGNLAYGTSSPSSNVQFNGAGPVLRLQTASTSDVTGVSLRFHQTDTTIVAGQSYGGVEWDGDDTEGSGVRGYIRGNAEGSSGEFSLRFATQGSGVSAPVERLVVNAAGSVGIGTVTPSTTLHVVGTITGSLALINSVDVLANDGVTLATARGNDHSTLLSAYANDVLTLATARGNDHSTLLSAQANDYNSYLTISANDGVTLATARGNDHSTLLSAYANDVLTLATARGNDHSTLLSAYANDVLTLATARGNDHSTLLSAYANDVLTLATARGNDHTTFVTVTANLYNTFVSLNANLGSSTYSSQTIYTVTTTNNYTMRQSVASANNILVSLSGLTQIPWTSYTVYGNTTLRLNNTAPLIANIPIEIRFL